MKDGDLVIGESAAILRYLAMKYKPEFYPVSDPAACAMIDFALYSFASEVYPKFQPVVYPVLGLREPPEDKEKAEVTEMMDTWSKHFLKGKFVCGDKITIADLKAVPSFFAANQPAVEAATGFKVSDRLKKYCDDFCAAFPASKLLKEDPAGVGSIEQFFAK